MVAIEIPPNTNCEAVDLRIFNDVEAPKAVSQVCLERTPNQPAWYEVTGWTTTDQPCPAVARRVDDSGEGLAVLVSGGDAGLRLRPSGTSGSWQVEDPAQWGAPFLLMATDPEAVMYREDV